MTSRETHLGRLAYVPSRLSQVLLITENFSSAEGARTTQTARGGVFNDKTMLAAPEAAAWAAHPAARAGKLEKRGRLKDEWKARHFELRGCYLVCFADAKEGRPALAVFDVTKVACARDATDPEDVFGLRVLEGSIKLRAADKITRRAWMAAICEAQEAHFEERRRRSRELAKACN